MNPLNWFKPRFTVVGERAADGHYYIKLVARNGEIVMHGESLTRGDTMRRIAARITTQTGWPFIDKTRKESNG